MTTPEAMWATLAAPPADAPPTFDPATLADLPEPARRFLGQALPSGVPLDPRVRLEMTGSIKLGPRWFRFTARQLIHAGMGLVWQPVVGGHVLRFTGADLIGPGDARMEFRLHGKLPVVNEAGEDVAHSGRGRLAAETVVWAPQALAPQCGATWAAIDERRASVTIDAAGEAVRVEVAVDADGTLTEVGLARWNGSFRPPAYAPFGGTCTSTFTSETGVRIAGSGEVGWGWGTPEADAGRFFRYQITAAGAP